MSEWISEFIPDDIDHYTEVFGGAFWLYLKSDVYKFENLESVTYNDVNKFMVNLFTSCVNYREFRDELIKIPAQDKELFDSYLTEILDMYDDGSVHNMEMPRYDVAYKYAYLMTQIWSGTPLRRGSNLIKVNGKSKFDSFKDKFYDMNFTKRFDKITTVSNLDFEECVNQNDSPTSFFYVDPPYYGKENYYGFNDYTRDDHERLMNVLKSIEGKFMLSYYEFDELNDWFPTNEYWREEKDFNVPGGARYGSTQGKNTEVLIMNYTKDDVHVLNKPTSLESWFDS